MDEKKEKRTSASVAQEYNNLAFKAGNLQYSIREQQRSLDSINQTMLDLTLEFNGLKAEEDKAAAEAAKASEKTVEESK